jgi:predicted SAM-dependent methyltransferase
MSTRLTTAGLRQAVKHLLLEARLWRAHRGGMRKARSMHESNLKLHLGSGPHRKQGWVNIDLFQPADLALDLRERLPFADNSCAIVYSEHVFEHFDYPEPAMSMLRDWLRVLQPGGTCRIGVPDTEWPLAEYVGVRNEQYFATAKARWHPSWCQTPMEHVNYHFRQGAEHRFAYDTETLIAAMTRAGFVEAQRVSYDATLDSPERELGTLYVTGKKR